VRPKALTRAVVAATLVGLSCGPAIPVQAGVVNAGAARARTSVNPVAAKADYLRTRGTPLHQAAPTVDSTPARSPVAPRHSVAPSVAGQAGSLSNRGGSWTPVGPKPINNFGSFGNVSGRVTSLAVDPTSAAIVYAGTAGGGVWKTTDGGANWSPLTDSQATLSIGAVAVDPNNHLTVYAATGENDRCGDCGPSQGVLKSTDGGATWMLLGQTTFATSNSQASAIVVDRTNSNRVLVGTSTGLYISANGGSSWAASNLNNFGSLGNMTTPRTDVVFQEPSSPRIWAAFAKRCQDKAFIAYWDPPAGTWTVAYQTAGFVERIGLDAGSDHTLYAAESSCPDNSGGNFGDLVAIRKSTNAFASWTTIASASLTNYFRAAPTASGQGWYDNVVAVDRTNSNRAVFGGVTMLATSDGGTSFTDIAHPYASGPLHPDFHAVAFTGANTFYTANDGGVWKTTNLGGSGTATDWTNLNASLAITTFYSGTALDATHMIGGAQDIGTSGLVPGGPTPPAWKPLLIGDGTWTAMNPTPGSNVIYGETPFGFIFKGVSSETVIDPRQPGSHWAPAGPCWFTTDPACNDPSGFVAPFLMDPADPSHLWSGTNKIYESRSGGTPAGASGWPAAPSRDLTTGTSILSGGDWISSLSYDRASGVLASASYGGAVFVKNGRTATAALDWVNATGNLPPATASGVGNDAWVTDVWVGAAQRSGVGNFNDMWVTMSGNGIGHVWHATPSPFGQGPWVDMSGSGSTGVGNLVVDSIAVTPSAVVVGTDAGVLVCSGCLPPNPTPPGWVLTPAWYSLGAGLPNAKVDALRLSNDGSLLVAWTHGRGAWTIPVQAMADPSPTPMAFGKQKVGTSAQKTLTTTSVGLGPLSFTAPPSISGPNAGDFAMEPSNCVPGYGPYLFGEHCTLRVTFTPSAFGARTATLSLYDNASTSPQTISVSGTGAGLNAVQQSPPGSPASMHDRLLGPPGSGGGFHGWIPTQPLNNLARIASNPRGPAAAPATKPSPTQGISAMEDLMARITAFLRGF
jgi:hypothetical protein